MNTSADKVPVPSGSDPVPQTSLSLGLSEPVATGGRPLVEPHVVRRATPRGPGAPLAAERKRSSVVREAPEQASECADDSDGRGSRLGALRVGETGSERGTVVAMLNGVNDLGSPSMQLLETRSAALAPCWNARARGPSWPPTDSALPHLDGVVVGLREAAGSPGGTDFDQFRSALHEARSHLSAWHAAQERDSDPGDRWPGPPCPRSPRGGADPQ